MVTTGSRLIVVAILLTTFLPTHSSAFDGQRKGFVIGMGFGYSPNGKWTQPDYDLKESDAGLGFNIMIGYAPTNTDLFVLERSGSSRKSPLLNSTKMAQWLPGARWYHYFREDKGWCSCVGVGAMVFSSEYRDIRGTGPGVTVGLGYEPVRHFMAGCYLITGRSSSEGRDFNHLLVMFLVTGALF